MSSSSIPFRVGIVPKSSSPPVLLGVAIAAGVIGAMTLQRTTSSAAAVSSSSSPSLKHRSSNMLEQQFGTADGYFPSATPGALLSNPPGNKNAIAGEHYVANSERRKYTIKRKTILMKERMDQNKMNE